MELGRWHDPSARLDQLWLLKWIRIFLLMPVSETLSMYSEALLISHPSVAPHLYDVLRYCLKLRPDLSAADYHPALATCHEYIKQHDGASMVASPLPLTPAVELLKELLPKAGVMHCTGTGEGQATATPPFEDHRTRWLNQICYSFCRQAVGVRRGVAAQPERHRGVSGQPGHQEQHQGPPHATRRRGLDTERHPPYPGRQSARALHPRRRAPTTGKEGGGTGRSPVRASQTTTLPRRSPGECALGINTS